MKLDPNSEKPLHIQAEEVLRKLIESEEYKNGKLLPNEVLLSEQLNMRYCRGVILFYRSIKVDF